jgi:hypothetical protein
MKQKLTLELELEGTADAYAVVDRILDEGRFQEAIEEFDSDFGTGPLRVLSVQTVVASERPHAMPEALRLFAAMSTSERWAYWANQCTLYDLFKIAMPPRDTHIQLDELINTWVGDSSDRA